MISVLLETMHSGLEWRDGLSATETMHSGLEWRDDTSATGNHALWTGMEGWSQCY